jgi:DNA-binding NarL/FixJ family response regulator
MKNSPLRTILFGRSILLAGLESSLLNYGNIKIIRSIDEMSELEKVSSNEVDLVLFDSTMPEAKKIPSLLENDPKLLVLGLDLSEHHMTLYSGKNYTINSFSDIADFINQQSDY